MPRTGKRAQHLRSARKSKTHNTPGGRDKYDGISVDSPLKAVATGQRRVKARQRFDPSEPPKPLRIDKRKTQHHMKSSYLLLVEKKYQGILELLHVKWASEKRQVTNAKAEEIAS